MRRTDEEFKAEVYRRSGAFQLRRKKRIRKTALLCLPVLICWLGFLALVTGGFQGMGSTAEGAFDVAQSVECNEAPAAALEDSKSQAPMEGEQEFAFGSTCAPADSGTGTMMPEDFNIRFTWAIGAENVYDTYAGQLQKDLVLDGVAEADFEPEDDVLEEIWRMLLELDIACIDREMTSQVLTTTDDLIDCEPMTVYEIRFTMDGQDYTVTGDDTAFCYPEDADAVHFTEFVNFMYEIVRNTPEYQELPEENGGYD